MELIITIIIIIIIIIIISYSKHNSPWRALNALKWVFFYLIQL